MFLTPNGRHMRSGITLNGRSTVKITTWLWIGWTIATLVTSQQNFYTNGRYGKRQDPLAASSFWSGSRYGRSGDSSVIGGGGGGGSVNDDDKINPVESKDVELSPRTDRFFLGSRYGKRTLSNDQRTMIDSLKHFETSLDFLISVGHLQTTDKEQLKILNNVLKNNGNLITMKSDDDDDNNNNASFSSSSSSRFIKSYGSLSENGFTCLYTGVTNLYRCFHRKNYETTLGSSN